MKTQHSAHMSIPILEIGKEIPAARYCYRINWVPFETSFTYYYNLLLILLQQNLCYAQWNLFLFFFPLTESYHKKGVNG